MIANYGALETQMNTALSELDKALRSNNSVGEKAQGIVKVSEYFEKHPLPIFVNSVFVTLMENFRNTQSNFLRKCILQVAERSQTHLDKIISRDVVVKDILAVSYSNDPIARALTLRVLGFLACIFGDRQQMHHLIRTSLDSRDPDELEAAIFAAERFAESSEEFSKGIYDKVASMLLCIDVPLSTKVAVVPVFQHMHTDPTTTEKVFHLCKTELLPKCNNTTLICSILRTLNCLAITSLTSFSIQIEILLDALNNSTSFSVKRTTLFCLKQISKRAPHFCTKDVFGRICAYAVNLDTANKRNNVLRLNGFNVLSSLAENKIISGWGECFTEAVCLFNACSTWIALGFDSVLAFNCQVLAYVFKNGDRNENLDRLASQFFERLCNIISVWKFSREANEEYDVDLYAKMLLRSVIILCQRYEHFSHAACRTISGVFSVCSVDEEHFVFDSLMALCDCEPSIIDDMKTSSLISRCRRYRAHFVILTQLTPIDETFLSSLGFNDWALYRLGRFAARFGCHGSAAKVFEQVQRQVLSDYFYQWTKGLVAVSRAEIFLSNGGKISDAISSYLVASLCFKAASLPPVTLWFPCEYVALKIDFINLIDELRVIWNLCRITPPPTVSVLTNNRQDQSAHFVNQISNCAKGFDSLADRFEKLTCRCFDADSFSLNALQLEQMKCIFVRNCLFYILDREYKTISLIHVDRLNATCKIVRRNLERAINRLNDFSKESERISTSSVKSVFGLINEVVRQPTYVPRFFFQTVQTTAIKLVIQPQPKETENAITLISGQSLSITVEGVIQSGGHKTKTHRRVSDVTLYVTTDFGEVKLDKKHAPIEQCLEKSVKPHNDYFLAEFVLPFPQTGVIFVRADVTDDVDGRLWDIGAEEQLRIKVKSATDVSKASTTNLLSSLSRTPPTNRT